MAEKNDQDQQQQGDNGPNEKRGQTPKGPQPFMSRSAVSWMIVIGLGLALLLLYDGVSNNAEEVSWVEFKNHAKLDHFEKPISIEGSKMTGVLKENIEGANADAAAQRRIAFKFDRQAKEFYLRELQTIQDTPAEKGGNPNLDWTDDAGESLLWPILFSWGPIILLLLFVYFFIFRSIRNAGGGPGGMLGNFGKSKHRITNKEHSTVTLSDVAGIDEAKDEVTEIIEFLKNPKKFQRLGGRVPRGVLLIGEPGCGKTLLAKAVAGEADVPFFSISGSDFVEMFVGVGASRVRDLFKQAKDSSPCIIFLDEIDAVGRRRGSGFSSGGHDEREQTLNAILVEMDGFDSSDQIIVVAATNRSDVLDPALTRPGRFDRQIHVPMPDLQGRYEILKVHAARVKLGPDVNLEKLARGTPMFSGADLSAIINEAAIGATLQNKDFIEHEDLEEARDKVKWGRARKSHRIEEDEKKVIAFHEAGHAAVMYYDEQSEPLHKVTIIPRGQALGVTFMLPEKDRHLWTRKQLMSQLRVTFGGRIAEEMFCGDITSGAAQDVRQATAIARAMITQYAMSEKLGFQLYGQDDSRNPWEQPERSYSEDTARLIDEEVKQLIDTAYSETRQLLEEHRDQVTRLAEALLKFETLNRSEVDRIMAGQPLNKTTVSDLLKAEQDRHAGDKSQQDQAPDAADQTDADDTPDAMPSPA